MKEMAKRTAIAALVGVTAVSMLAGCGEKALDGSKTVATVNGTEIPMGVLSLYVRQQQAQTEMMYLSFMGSVSDIWDNEAEDGKTYGEQAVEQALQDIELMYIMKEKAADYGVEVTEEDQKAIEEAAASFMEANSEETIETLAVTEEQVKTLLELETYQTRIYDPIVADVDTEIPEDEVQQSGFTYVSISTSGDELTEDDIKEKEEQAQEILDKMLEDPSADMDEVASEVDESYSAVSGNFTTNESDNEEIAESTYPEEVITALRGLGEGEVYDSLIETDTGYYIVRLDKEFDEEATESEKESIISTRESNLYTETTEGWMDEADITVDEKVLKTLTITDSHGFTIQTAEDTETAQETEDVTEEDAAAEDTETGAEEEDAAAGTEDSTDAGDVASTEEPEVTEEAEETEDVTEEDAAAEDTETTENTDADTAEE